MTDAVSLPAGSVAAPARAAPRSYLYGPLIDFLCLGGGSLFILFPALLLTSEEMRPGFVMAGLITSYLLAQPHFAHSYQIFYRGFRRKLTSDALPPVLRARYLLSGVIVPITMIVFFFTCWMLEDAGLLGLSVNVLALTVGWHYVKQGYGMLMVECVLKRCFFNDREKARLKFNAYAIWIFSWVFANVVLHQKRFMGLESLTLDLPQWLLAATAFVALAATLVVVFTIGQKWVANEGRLPFNGLVAYFASVYVWIYAIYTDPMLLLVVPAFHSIQYIAVVWRYQLNRERAEAGAAPEIVEIAGFSIARPILRLARFAVLGLVLGAIGFQTAPYLIGAVASESQAFGPSMYVVMFWIFFNVHHYFLDNVMWRKENPDIKQHLFTPR